LKYALNHLSLQAAWGGVLLLVLSLLPVDNHAATRASGASAGMAEVNGTRLHYETAGKGSDLVLIHGGLADSRLWDEQFKEFAKRYRVIRYDLRGFGKSDFPAVPFSHVEDLYALLKFLKVERAALVGLSLGGMIAADFTLEHPEMVQSLVLTSSGLRGFKSPRSERTVAIYKAAETEGRERAIEMWLDHPFFSTGKSNPAYRRRMQRMLADNFRFWGPTKEPIIVNWPKPPTNDRLAQISKPVIIIVGDEDDKNILNVADTLAAKISGASKVVMRGVSHHLNMEKPKEFNKIVLKFLSAK
jgi:pimeloyl-ACP methyl ester carboxylesterase